MNFIPSRNQLGWRLEVEKTWPRFWAAEKWFFLRKGVGGVGDSGKEKSNIKTVKFDLWLVFMPLGDGKVAIISAKCVIILNPFWSHCSESWKKTFNFYFYPFSIHVHEFDCSTGNNYCGAVNNRLILPLFTTGHRRCGRVALLNNDLKLAAHWRVTVNALSLL